jgi:hypothetical protein
MHRCSKWFPTFRFSNHNFVRISDLSHPLYMPTHRNLLVLITLTISYEAWKLRSSSFCSLLHPPTPSSLLRPNILISTLPSNTLYIWSSLGVGTKFHTHTIQE